VLFVVDSAYAEFVGAEDYSAGLELVDAAENVVMTRTFSKAYGLAALRLGWCYGPPAIIDVLNRVRGPFNVTAPAQAAGIAALGDQDFLAQAKRHNDQWRPWLEQEAKALGYRVIPSVANFVMVGSRDGAAVDDLNRHLISHGVLVRDMRGYGLGDFLRVSVGSEEETRAVVEALASYPASNPD
jgi:histidinol-phosphate aminotransferase